MIPQQENNDGLTLDFEEITEPSKTFNIDFEKGRIIGYTDGKAAMKQAIFLMLSIERYDHIIFSWNIGRELKNLIGKPTAFVASEAPRRISECLLQDDRITSVDYSDVTINKKSVHIKGIVNTIFGEVEFERKVNTDGRTI